MCKAGTAVLGGWEEKKVPQELTKELFERIDAEFDAAQTAEDVRAVFKRYYSDLGWKRLCRLFVLQYGVDELWHAETERAAKSGKTDAE
jgi:hypothetical protein